MQTAKHFLNSTCSQKCSECPLEDLCMMMTLKETLISNIADVCADRFCDFYAVSDRDFCKHFREDGVELMCNDQFLGRIVLDDMMCRIALDGFDFPIREVPNDVYLDGDNFETVKAIDLYLNL